MNCPACKHGTTAVLDSRYRERGGYIRRRRRCEECLHRFTTHEQPVDPADLDDVLKFSPADVRRILSGVVARFNDAIISDLET